jgi:hypothetical protein
MDLTLAVELPVAEEGSATRVAVVHRQLEARDVLGLLPEQLRLAAEKAACDLVGRIPAWSCQDAGSGPKRVGDAELGPADLDVPELLDERELLRARRDADALEADVEVAKAVAGGSRAGPGECDRCQRRSERQSPEARRTTWCRDHRGRG